MNSFIGQCLLKRAERLIALTVVRFRTQRAQHAKKPSVAKIKDKWISSKISSAVADQTTQTHPKTFSEGQIVDNVWLLSDFSPKPFSITDAISNFRRTIEYYRLGSVSFCVRFELNMTTDRKTKFLPNIRGLIDFPKAFDHGPSNSVILFCKRDHHVELARKFGCYLYGHEDLIKMFVAGEVMDFSYDYLLSTPDVYGDIGRLRKRVGVDKFPTQANGQLVIDLEAALKKFRFGHFYESCKLSDSLAILRINIGKVDMDDKDLEENFHQAVNEISGRHIPPDGRFIKSASLLCPPAIDRVPIDVDLYTQESED